METIEHIEQILENTFNVLDNAFLKNDEAAQCSSVKFGTRLIFPHYSNIYRDGEKRLSEQELRFVFIEQFNKYCDEHKDWNVFYSVETPTEQKYKFSGVSEPRVVIEGEEGGQSAMFDTVIHNGQGKRICYIEFKAKNPDQDCYLKDFVKLNEEAATGNGLFVQILESANQGTFKSIRSKLFWENQDRLKNVIYICHVLTGKCKGTYYMSKIQFVPVCDKWKKHPITEQH